MKVVLIVLNYNDVSTTLNFINSISSYKVIDKIIVVDNCSTDDSYIQLSQKLSSKIDLIQCSQNNGYACGNNQGIRYAQEKYNPQFVIISNPDVFFEEEVVKSVIDSLNLSCEYAIGTATMVETTPTRNLKAYKIGGYIHHTLSTLPIIGRIYNNKLIRYPSSLFRDPISEVEVIPGSFFVAKMSCLESVDYFSELTFLYGEEEILGYKLKSKGFKAIILNNETYEHHHSVSINKSIKSNVNKHRILQNSRRIFLKEFLKVSNCKLFLFDLITFISLKERVVLNYIRNIGKNK